MKLKYLFETVDMGDELIAVPIGKNASEVHGVLKYNKEANEIINLIFEEKNEEEIVDLLGKKYDNNKHELVEYVRLVIDTLKKHDIIEE